MQSRYFSYISNKIASAKQEADGLSANLGHRGIEGQIREIAAKNCVEPFLTQSYQCGTGKVIDSSQATSDQIDLILFHKKVAPPILVNRELGLYPVECVKYVFEVKTKLTASEVRDANKKFRSVSILTSFPRQQPDGTVKGGRLPVTVLLAFGSDIKGSEVERYMKHTEGRCPCTVLCVLGKGYWVFDYTSNAWHGYDFHPDHPPFTEFCIFVTGLMNTLAAEETSMRPFSSGLYVNADQYLADSQKSGWPKQR